MSGKRAPLISTEKKKALLKKILQVYIKGVSECFPGTKTKSQNVPRKGKGYNTGILQILETELNYKDSPGS